MQEVPLSLYFGVAKGERPTLETIARASIEWSAAVHEIADMLSPGIDIRVEFLQSEDGSVWLQNLIKAARDGDRKALISVAAGVLLFFAIGPALHLQEDFGEEIMRLLGHEHDIKLSDEEKDDIARRVAEALETTSLGDRRKAIVREVERDPKITSIGVDTTPRLEGPRVLIERHEFPLYGAASDFPTNPISPRRTVHEYSVDVIIIRPSLRSGEYKPRWRFMADAREWSADIDDEEFVRALHERQTGLLLAVGQHMVVDLAVDFRMSEDGLWHECNRRVVKVINPPVDRRQRLLV